MDKETERGCYVLDAPIAKPRLLDPNAMLFEKWMVQLAESVFRECMKVVRGVAQSLVRIEGLLGNKARPSAGTKCGQDEQPGNDHCGGSGRQRSPRIGHLYQTRVLLCRVRTSIAIITQGVHSQVRYFRTFCHDPPRSVTIDQQGFTQQGNPCSIGLSLKNSDGREKTTTCEKWNSAA